MTDHAQANGMLVDVKVPFYESMTKAVDPVSGATIRVWRREEKLPEYNDVELMELLANIPSTYSMQQIIDKVCSIGRIAAIELTDSAGLGAVIYTEW